MCEIRNTGCNPLYYNNCNNNNLINPYKPCEHIDDVVKKLRITKRNKINDERIRKYLFDNCCNKHNKFNYIKTIFIFTIRKIYNIFNK